VNDSTPKPKMTLVRTLSDGRLFVADADLIDAPELAQWFADGRAANYWQYCSLLQGYVAPCPEIETA
jgi:hypothetical protein